MYSDHNNRVISEDKTILRDSLPRSNMPLSQALQHMLRMNLITLIESHPNPKTSSPNYNPDARYVYHSGSPGHDTSDCWALKYKIQNIIDAKEIDFNPLETPNMIIAPMPNH